MIAGIMLEMSDKPKYLKSLLLICTKTRLYEVCNMRKNKSMMFTLTLLVIVSISISTMLSSTQGSTDVNPQADISNIVNATPLPTTSGMVYTDEGYNNISVIDYGLNATTIVNRTINIENFGVLSISDRIEFKVIGNENITCFNYTLPNIHTNNITFASFRVANASFDLLFDDNATQTYTFNKLLNYTTFVIPFNVNKTAIHQNDIYFINSYIEFAMPYTYELYAGEQVSHYSDLLYPLINNVPMVNGSVWVIKQGGDLFLNTPAFPISPGNGTEGITVINDAASGSIRWSNMTRLPFNYSQSYLDDLQLSIHISSVSTADPEQQSSTLLFKATEVDRIVEIDPYGLVQITETQTIVFLGGERPEDYNYFSPKLYALNSFPIVFPKNASVTNLFDDAGSLNLAYQINEDGYYEEGAYNLRDSTFPGHQALLIFPREPLFHGEEMTFTIVYTVPMDSVLEKEQGSSNYKLTLAPLSIVNWTVDNLNLEIILPKGVVYKELQYNNPDPYQDMIIDYGKVFDFTALGNKRVVSLKFTNFSGSDNAPIVINYTYTGFNMIITFFWQFMTVGIIFAVYLGIHWSTKRVKGLSETEKAKEFIPTDEIELFIKQYEEVLAIKERLRETRAKISLKKLKAKEGKDLQVKLEKRLRVEEETLKSTKIKLSALGGRYKETVQKIEIAERKLYEERRNLRALQQEYRTKKSMTKESYSKLFRERQQTIERLKNEINGQLVGLRMLLES
ncbi:MAG: hypothetical protein KGD64_03545 [Candidatus Heimdallarchaeota archaeon]|nr:hypothetical protein [Candidatus Heimdallarchaeota archaeon]